MTREDGIKQIEEAPWVGEDEAACLNLFVEDEDDMTIHAWLTPRPAYCDRGHIQLDINGPLGLDRCDSFPRYYTSFDVADMETRRFLKWRLWKERSVPEAAIRSAFE